MKIVLFDINDQLCEAWEREFKDHDDVSVFYGKLEDVPASDCLVAAGNSFGIMDGGLDHAMAVQFPDVVGNVRDGIETAYCGEIPVSHSLIVPTGDEFFPWMAYTPTMRFPRKIPAETVYDAMRGMLLAVRKFNMNELEEAAIAEELGEEREAAVIETIACPGMGTRSGGVGAFTGAKMMRMAYESIIVRGPTSYGDKWDGVEDHLKKLYDR
jgi:O-acetyl-ADP-ribose deacetylase (regulator of RNase III)